MTSLSLREDLAVNTMLWRLEGDDGDWPRDKAVDLLTYIDKPHAGDCTKQPYTCLRCEAEAAYKQADQLLLVIGDAAAQEAHDRSVEILAAFANTR